MTKNPLTTWIQQFCKTKGPEAKPLEAWRYLTQYAPAHNVFDWIVRFDSEAKELIYRPSPIAAERRIGQESFSRLLRRTRQLAGFG